MKPQLLSTVALVRDIPEHGLRRGDVGVIVEAYGTNDFEVEFVAGDGHTQALITLCAADVRLLGPSDLLSARSLDAA